MATLNTITSLTVNSIMDIFLQISQNIQNAAAFKPSSRAHFVLPINKSEQMLS